jgi:hypothetical protein
MTNESHSSRKTVRRLLSRAQALIVHVSFLFSMRAIQRLRIV